jgi:hypothetical protein
MTHRKSKERGVYLLEVGASIVGVALFLMAVNDGTRLYQARSAVRAAVHEGLRCLYPTDAGCNSSTAGLASASSERQYNVFVSKPVESYSVAQETIRLRSSWQTAPVFEVPLTTASVTSVTVQSERDRFVQQEVLFPVNARLPYVIQTRPLPRVGGADPLRPAFYHPTTGRALSPNARIDLNSIRGGTRATARSEDDEYSSRFKIGDRTFSVSSAWRSFDSDTATIRQLERQHKIPVQCYQGPVTSGGTIDWGSSSAPKVCSYRSASNKLYRNGELRVPIMFHISGRISSSDPGAVGKVLISLSWDGKTRELGGRVLSPGGSGSFVVRGASWGDIRDAAEWSYREGGRYEREINLHGTLETIPLDTRVKITFTLVSLNGKSIGWTGDEMLLFYPTFDLVDQKFACDYSADPSRCVNPPPGAPILFSEVDKQRELAVHGVGSGECSEKQPATFEADPQARLSALKARIQRALPVTPVTMTIRAPSGAPGCTPSTRAIPCDARLSTDLPKGCEPRQDLTQIPSLCGLTLQAGRESVVGIVTGTAPTVTDSTTQFVACSDAPLPECARPHAREVGRVVLPRSEDGQSCSEALSVTTPPMIIGPVDVNACSDNSDGDVSQYRQSNSIPASVRVAVERFPAPSRATHEPVSGSCLQRGTSGPGTVESACGRNVTFAEVEQCCRANDGRCRWESVAAGGSAGGGTAGGSTTLIDAAKQRAVDTVRVAYPAARSEGRCDSGSPDCLHVSSTSSDNNDRVEMKARMVVPLTLLKPFNSAGIEVKHSAQRVSERSLLWE